jgi:hypothetical protein
MLLLLSSQIWTKSMSLVVLNVDFLTLFLIIYVKTMCPEEMGSGSWNHRNVYVK